MLREFRYPLKTEEDFYEMLKNVILQYGYNDVEVEELTNGDLRLIFFLQGE